MAWTPVDVAGPASRLSDPAPAISRAGAGAALLGACWSFGEAEEEPLVEALAAPAPASALEALPCEDVLNGAAELERLLNDPELLERNAQLIFRRSDCDGNGVLSLEELEALIPTLHSELGLPVGNTSDEKQKLLRSRMRRFDLDGNGTLGEQEFVELYRWTLWRKHEDMWPPKFTRAKIVGCLKTGAPTVAYDMGKHLGSGQFGIIHVVKHRATGADRVMKTISKQNVIESGTPLGMLQQEIDILAMLDHPHILRLFEHYQDTMNIYIVTSICDGGELMNIVEDHAGRAIPLPEAWIARVFCQTLEAIGYCHFKGVMHKDLKFENVMLKQPVTADSCMEEIHAVIIDVGLAELFGSQHGKSHRSNQAAGSLVTMAPEVLRGDFSYKCDIWSLGCLLYATFNTVPEYAEDDDGTRVLFTYPFTPGAPCKSDPMGANALYKAQCAGPDLDKIADTCSLPARECIKAMLCVSEKSRPSASECVRLPWLQDTDTTRLVNMSEDQVRSLTKHRETKTYWRAMTSTAAAYLPAAKIAHLSELFRTVDVDSNGTVEKEELCRMLVSQGVPEETAQTAANHADFDNSGVIEWSEFVAAVLPASQELFATALLTAFSHFDRDHDGALDVEEVEHLLRSGEIDATHMPAHKTVEAMLQELDTDHSGEISFAEFHSYFMHADDAAPTLSAG